MHDPGNRNPFVPFFALGLNDLLKKKQPRKAIDPLTQDAVAQIAKKVVKMLTDGTHEFIRELPDRQSTKDGSTRRSLAMIKQDLEVSLLRIWPDAAVEVMAAAFDTFQEKEAHTAKIAAAVEVGNLRLTRTSSTELNIETAKQLMEFITSATKRVEEITGQENEKVPKEKVTVLAVAERVKLAAGEMLHLACQRDVGKFEFFHARAEHDLSSTILSGQTLPHNLTEISALVAAIPCGPLVDPNLCMAELLPSAELRARVDALRHELT